MFPPAAHRTNRQQDPSQRDSRLAGAVLPPTPPEIAPRAESGPYRPIKSDDGNQLDNSLWAILAAQRAAAGQDAIIDQLKASLARANAKSAARLELLTDAYEQIDALDSQLEDAACAALSAQP